MKAPGEKVDRYVIEAHLGRGGMGEVYEATDTRLGRRVALKLIAPGADPDANQRMVREARAAAALQHPHAVVMYDVGEVDGTTFLAMELVRGTTLRARVGDASVPMGRRIRWLVDVARALGAAHRQGIVHRDVKPDNVMIREDGAAKVLDFGIARRQAAAVDPSAPTQPGAVAMSTLTAAGVIVGTPHYAAPEQLRGEPLDGRADEFAWAVMAYELLSGATPWSAGDSVALLAQILSAEPTLLATRVPDLPAPVAEAVTRALSKRAADRFATIDEAADAIEPFADSAAVSGKREATPSLVVTPPPTVLRRVVRGTGRAIVWFFALIGVVLVGGVCVGLFVAWKRGELVVDSQGKLGPRTATVGAITCADAKVEGEGATPELAHAVGRAACARLATHIGVDWGDAGTHKLEVEVKLSAGEAQVKLAVGAIASEGRGPTPIDAIVAASAGLAKRLSPPPLRDVDVRSWGAADEAGARRIERVWRELLLNASPNPDESVKALIASDPGSAWSHMIFVLVRPRRTEESKAAIRRGLELVDALPPARARALRGTFAIVDNVHADQLKEAMRLLRLAYAEAPDDGDVAGLYAAVAIAAGAQEEGFGVLDRLCERFPTKSLLALHNAIGRGIDRDLERDGRYLAKARALLPEVVAGEESVRFLGESGHFDEARAALAFGRRLGLSGKSMDAATMDLSASWIELVALSPKAARELASRRRGDPRIDVSSTSAAFGAAALQLEGRIVDAEAAEQQEMERLRALGTPSGGASFAFRIALARRWLGRPPPDGEVIAALEKLNGDLESLDWSASRHAVEAALARAAASPKDAKKILAAALERGEAHAEKQRERFLREGARLAVLPLVRAVRGDAAAAALWTEAVHAAFDVRRAVALDAALALDAAGQRDEADRAYAMAMVSRDLEGHALDAMIARLKLAALRRAAGKPDEAAALEATVDRLWQKADAGLVDAVKKLK
ncbi:serine/threonine protein kinase [Minicystis rosea]|nr:serine/threonine protein kinase [Minicystis rosea]